MSGPCFIYLFFFILLAYSIDSDSMTHLTAPTDLVDGCHKQLSQVWQSNTEVLYSNRFCKQRVPHCVQNENDCRGPPSPFQGAAISQRRLHVVSQPQSLPAMLWQMSLDDLARCYNTEATKTTLG